jgi:ubiquitin carboxyl-terminal hydrolase 25/28
MASLRTRISDIDAIIASSYNDIDRSRYVLYGIWVHQGVASSGHYWAFLRDPQQKWWRFNDVRVAEAPEEDVVRESIGGYSSSAAYFLIYLSYVARFILNAC